MKSPEKINNFEYCYTDPVAQFLLKNCNLSEYIELSKCVHVFKYVYKYIQILTCA